MSIPKSSGTCECNNKSHIYSAEVYFEMSKHVSNISYIEVTYNIAHLWIECFDDFINKCNLRTATITM